MPRYPYEDFFIATGMLRIAFESLEQHSFNILNALAVDI